jgi:hypothetical protein
MTEEAAATAATTEGATPAETAAAAAATTEAAGGQQAEGQLGPEGEKALNAETRAKELEERLSKIEEANKSESEKALDKARKEARQEAETEFEKERRSDRLAVAVAKHARELADVDDVVLNLERGDVDELFDEAGRVSGDALKTALAALLTNKPHLKASGVGRPAGSADGGEGEGGGGGSFNEALRKR